MEGQENSERLRITSLQGKIQTTCLSQKGANHSAEVLRHEGVTVLFYFLCVVFSMICIKFLSYAWVNVHSGNWSEDFYEGTHNLFEASDILTFVICATQFTHDVAGCALHWHTAKPLNPGLRSGQPYSSVGI
jgi:hypothetical protein